MLFGTPQEFTMGQILLAVPIGMALGLQGAMVVEIFPLRTQGHLDELRLQHHAGAGRWNRAAGRRRG